MTTTDDTTHIRLLKLVRYAARTADVRGQQAATRPSARHTVLEHRFAKSQTRAVSPI